jgi:hypothetical protein
MMFGAGREVMEVDLVHITPTIIKGKGGARGVKVSQKAMLIRGRGGSSFGFKTLFGGTGVI